ncbi:MAG: molybdenum cofactor carrier [FCB group bacterium]|nr:molybdenum cofactor carrier [FCB group bacterium]
MNYFPLQKIISGGQTGVDRAALDFAQETGIPHGGFCPRGRRAEDGPIDSKYQLEETESADYAVRTEANVLSADGTLVLYRLRPDGGTRLTLQLCRESKIPVFEIDLMGAINPAVKERFRQWLTNNRIRILNVAGNRESQGPIYTRTKEALAVLLTEI